jgi:hypothetical protein
MYKTEEEFDIVLDFGMINTSMVTKKLFLIDIVIDL